MSASNSKMMLNIKRIKFEDHSDDNERMLVSQKVFSDGVRVVRLVIKPDVMVFHIIDAATGFVFVSGGENINNLEVLQRNAKKALSKFLDANFVKEKRNTDYLKAKKGG